MINNFHDKVLVGVEKLSDDLGVLWVNRINIDFLDLSSVYACILGQCYGEYCEGLTCLGITNEDAVKYGFCVDCSYSNDDEARVRYDELTDEWKCYLRSRPTTSQ